MDILETQLQTVIAENAKLCSVLKSIMREQELICPGFYRETRVWQLASAALERNCLEC